MSQLTLPTERKVWEVEHGTIIFTCEHSMALGCITPKFAVQVIDQYRYQREWTIGLKHNNQLVDGRMKPVPCWESHMYRHPGVRDIQNMSMYKAMRLMERFHYLVENYPSLLFNKGEMMGGATPYWRPRHEGFVHMAEKLLAGMEASVRMIS